MSAVMAYIAIRPCGCTCMATVDELRYADSVAEAVADCLRAGYRIERVTVEEARATSWGCGTCREPVQESLELAAETAESSRDGGRRSDHPVSKA